MWSSRRRRRVLRSWRHRRVRQAAPLPGEAAAALARRGRRRRRGAGVSAAATGLARSPMRLVTAGTALALVLVLALVFLSGAHRVHGATVTGNRRVAAATVYAASGLDGASLWGADTAAAEARVRALDGIQSARVRLALPPRAIIEVRETALALLWQGPTGALAVDERGLASAPPADLTGLVVVRDLAGLLPGPGARLDPALVPAALAFAARFGALSYHPDTGFGALSPEGWELRLGRDAGLAARQLALLAGLRPALAGRTDLAFLDLRFTNRPYYRLRGGSE